MYIKVFDYSEMEPSASVVPAKGSKVTTIAPEQLRCEVGSRTQGP